MGHSLYFFVTKLKIEIWILEFFHNYTKFTKLAMKGKSQKISNKSYLQWGLNLGPLVFYSIAFLTELTWQVLIEGYLTSLLFVHQLTFGLGWFVILDFQCSNLLVTFSKWRNFRLINKLDETSSAWTKRFLKLPTTTCQRQSNFQILFLSNACLIPEVVNSCKTRRDHLYLDETHEIHVEITLREYWVRFFITAFCYNEMGKNI